MESPVSIAHISTSLIKKETETRTHLQFQNAGGIHLPYSQVYRKYLPLLDPEKMND
jgi:hypothetical protein